MVGSRVKSIASLNLKARNIVLDKPTKLFLGGAILQGVQQQCQIISIFQLGEDLGIVATIFILSHALFRPLEAEHRAFTKLVHVWISHLDAATQEAGLSIMLPVRVLEDTAEITPI